MPVSFELTEEQRMIRDMARDFAKNEIAPVAAEYDESAKFPWEVVNKAREIGLINTNIPAEYGGGGLSAFDELLIGEELAWGCTGISTSLLINNLAAIPIIVAGSDEQKKKWLGAMVDGAMGSYAVTEPGAGSDVAGMRTKAERHGDDYVIRGTKTFISNASVSDFFVVFAYTDKSQKHMGVSAFIVESDRDGFSVSKKFDKMGQRASDTAEISLDEVVVPEENRIGPEGAGFLVAMRVFDFSRPGVAIGAVGLARRAMEEAVAYAKEREAFGKNIWKFQGVGHKVADMRMNIDAARLLAWRAGWLVDQDKASSRLAAEAKAFAADMAMQVTTDAVQIFGGYGYMREYPVEKLMRDCKVFQIYEGTSEIQRNIIVRETFKS